MTTLVYTFEVHDSLDNPHGKKKLLNMMSFTLKAFGVTDLIVVTNHDVQLSDLEMTFQSFATLEEALAVTTGTVVFLEEGGTPLNDFTHPDNAVYVLGSNYGEIVADEVITIPTLNALHAEVVAGIVLNHRANG